MNEAFEKAKLHALHAKRLIAEAKKNKIGRQCVKCNNLSLVFPLINVGNSDVNLWCEDCIKELLKRCKPISRSVDKRVPPQGYKICKHCREIKPLSEFASSRDRKDGLHPHCKTCCSEMYYKKRILTDYRKLGKKPPEID